MPTIDDVKTAREALLLGATVLSAAISIYSFIRLVKDRQTQ